MARYLVEVNYAPEALAGMMKNPEDRAAPVRAAIESLGGKMEALYFTLGSNDAIVISEVPDNVAAAALAIAVGATGRYTSYSTTPLLTSQELIEAMRAAGKVSFRPAGG